MTVRPGLWRPSVVLPWGFVLSVFVAGAVSEFVAGQPGAAAVALICPVPIFLFAWVMMRQVRLEVTESMVLVWQGRRRGHPDNEAPRREIRAIHYFPRVISFRGLDDEPMMRIRCNYTLRQMAQVAAILEVPLYDHRGRLGLGEVTVGRLVDDPAAAHRGS